MNGRFVSFGVDRLVDSPGSMEVIAQMAAAQGACALLDVSRGHIDGCILAHDANLIFAETMADMGAQVGVPATTTAIDG